MTSYFAYTRVSSERQGENGVSLREQRFAITEFALKTHLTISQWFEERVTAAATGRPVFEQMVSLLRSGQARGVILHKIDRGARNLRDWADLGELIDQGVDVRFVQAGLDVQTRSGRLSADIQAVVAADYIRNLREEARKGFYGRLKQGLFPLPAPFGYQNNGGGKAKTIHPEQGLLVQRAFSLYVSNDWSLKTLSERLGGEVSIASLGTMLRNPFYTGRIRLQSGAEFPGIHEPLISETLFHQVQTVIRSRRRRSMNRHTFTFSRMVTCACGYFLIAERQKGRVYYRCHQTQCSVTGIREEQLDQDVIEELSKLPEKDILLFAYQRAGAVHRRLLLHFLKVQITVRGLVRPANGLPRTCILGNANYNTSELGRILQEMLMAQLTALEITRIHNGF